MKWLAEQLRFTVFTPDEPSSKSIPSWLSVFGEEAPNRQLQPLGMGRLESGRWREANLLLQVQAGRIDILAVQPEDAVSSDGWQGPQIGAYDQSMTDFSQVVAMFLRGANDVVVTRLAIGVSVACPVETRELGYEQMASLITTFKVPRDARELVFQINWPRASKAKSGVIINRLATWSVGIYKQAMAVISPDGRRSAERFIGFATRAVLDINTDPESCSRIDPDDRLRLFEEMNQMANEIIAKGESR